MGEQLSEPRFGEFLVEGPYAESPYRFVGLAITAAVVCVGGWVVFRFAADSLGVVVVWAISALLMLLFAWRTSYSERAYPNEWRFDDAGWSSSEPFGGAGGRVLWADVTGVELRTVGYAQAIVLETVQGSYGVVIGTVRRDKVGVFVEQLAEHLPGDVIDPKVLALGGRLETRSPGSE